MEDYPTKRTYTMRNRRDMWMAANIVALLACFANIVTLANTIQFWMNLVVMLVCTYNILRSTRRFWL